MADNRPLYEYIGDPIAMLGSSLSSAAWLASDMIAGVPALGADGILFIQVTAGTATDTTAVHQIQIQYSSTGLASDAATSNATMTCTDAIFAAAGPVDSLGDLKMVDLRISAKAGMEASAGKFYATIAAAETAAGAQVFLVGIPYGGTRLYPATNANTAVLADHNL